MYYSCGRRTKEDRTAFKELEKKVGETIISKEPLFLAEQNM